METEPKFHIKQIVHKVTGDYKFIGSVRGVIEKRNGNVRYVVEDGRGSLHIFNADQLELYEPVHFQSNDDIVAEIERIIIMNSSPMVSIHDGIHSKQAGYILWEHDGLQHVIHQILKLFTTHDLVKQKDQRINDLLQQISYLEDQVRSLDNEKRTQTGCKANPDTHPL